MKASLRNLLVTGTLGVAALALMPAAAQAEHKSVRGGISFRIGVADVRIGGHGDHVHVNVDHVRRVWVPGHYEERHTKVLVSEGHWDLVTRKVQVSEGHWDEVTHQVKISEGHWDTVYHPPVYRHVTDRYGRCTTVMVKPGCHERVWHPAQYETRVQRVWHPAEYETRTERVWHPPQYETRCERVYIPGHYEEVRTPVISDRHDHGHRGPYARR